MWGDAIDGLVVDGNEKVTKVVSSVGIMTRDTERWVGFLFSGLGEWFAGRGGNGKGGCGSGCVGCWERKKRGEERRKEEDGAVMQGLAGRGAGSSEAVGRRGERKKEKEKRNEKNERKEAR